MPTTGFVDVFRTYNYPISMVRFALCPICRISAHDTDGQCLCDVLGDRQELRHRLKWLAFVVLVQSSYYYALALIREQFTHVHEIGFEELTFIDTDNLSTLAEFDDL